MQLILQIKGTKNIINLSPAKVKIIFPSTHVVFDGLKKSKKLIPENYKKTPLLPYSSSKSKNEDDLIFKNILIDKTSADLLKDSEVDYVSELIGESFKISNPQTKSSCGCGVSFSL